MFLIDITQFWRILLLTIFDKKERQMDRGTFFKILAEEGLEDPRLRADLWNSQPPRGLNEERLRRAVRKFKDARPGLETRQAINDAMDREYERNK